MLDKCCTECSNGFNTIQHFRELMKCFVDVEWKFKRIKFDWTRLQQCWMTCSNAPNIWFNKVLNACWNKCWNRLNGPLAVSFCIKCKNNALHKTQYITLPSRHVSVCRVGYFVRLSNARARCKTCPFIHFVDKISAPKRSIKSTDLLHEPPLLSIAWNALYAKR